MKVLLTWGLVFEILKKRRRFKNEIRLAIDLSQFMKYFIRDSKVEGEEFAEFSVEKGAD